MLDGEPPRPVPPPPATPPRPHRTPQPAYRDGLARRIRTDPGLRLRAALAAAVGTAAVLGLVVGAVLIVGSGDPSDPAATTAATDTPVRPPLVLPLDLALVGFDEGLVEPTPIDEGPAALGYCNRRPVADRLDEWQGNRLTDAEGRRRVAQMVARFQSSTDAAAHLTSITESTDCSAWTTGEGPEAITFTVSESPPSAVHGDETRRFDLVATSEGPNLFLRTVVVRSGRDVAQFTYVSANQQDLDVLDELVATSVSALGF